MKKIGSQYLLDFPKDQLLVTLKEFKHTAQVNTKTLYLWRRRYGLEPAGYTGNVPVYRLSDIEEMERKRCANMRQTYALIGKATAKRNAARKRKGGK